MNTRAGGVASVVGDGGVGVVEDVDVGRVGDVGIGGVACTVIICSPLWSQRSLRLRDLSPRRLGSVGHQSGASSPMSKVASITAHPGPGRLALPRAPTVPRSPASAESFALRTVTPPAHRGPTHASSDVRFRGPRSHTARRRWLPANGRTSSTPPVGQSCAPSSPREIRQRADGDTPAGVGSQSKEPKR
jgi:hypothetical protein